MKHLTARCSISDDTKLPSTVSVRVDGFRRQQITFGLPTGGEPLGQTLGHVLAMLDRGALGPANAVVESLHDWHGVITFDAPGGVPLASRVFGTGAGLNVQAVFSFYERLTQVETPEQAWAVVEIAKQMQREDASKVNPDGTFDA